MLEVEKYMKEALKQAKRAYDKEEIPVGAIIVKDHKIIARAYNEKEYKLDTTKHAEILAIQKASKKLLRYVCYLRTMQYVCRRTDSI